MCVYAYSVSGLKRREIEALLLVVSDIQTPLKVCLMLFLCKVLKTLEKRETILMPFVFSKVRNPKAIPDFMGPYTPTYSIHLYHSGDC